MMREFYLKSRTLFNLKIKKQFAMRDKYAL